MYKRQGADPSLNNQTCSLRAKPACCDFARLALRISQHRSASSKRKPRYHFSTFFFGTSDRLRIMPQGRQYWNLDGIISGLLVLALCPLRCNPAEELIQAPTTRPARSALSQHAVTLPSLRFASHSIAPQAASASPGHHFSTFLLVLPNGLALCLKAGILLSLIHI